MEFTPINYKVHASTDVHSLSKPTLQRSNKKSPAEQARLVNLWQKSGMTQTQFCQQHGIALKTFSRWKCSVIKHQTKQSVSKPKDTHKINKGSKATYAAVEPRSLALTDDRIDFQACLQNGVVLTFTSLSTATVIHLIKGLCDANPIKCP